MWALPFLTALAPSERYCTEHQHRRNHKKITDWARQMILLVCRWLKGQKVIITADSSYSALELLAAIRGQATLITRLRLDAALYDPVQEVEKKNPGRPRLKGRRQPTLAQRLEDAATQWAKVTIPQWYDQQNKELLLTSGTAIWYHSGMKPVPVRWVLLKAPEEKGEPAALLCTDLMMEGMAVVNYFIRRWTVEVTFKEVRAHLGVETQRQWSDKAIARSTPCLMGLFSIAALWADKLQSKVLKGLPWSRRVGIRRSCLPSLMRWLRSGGSYGTVTIFAHPPQKGRQWKYPPIGLTSSQTGWHGPPNLAKVHIRIERLVILK